MLKMRTMRCTDDPLMADELAFNGPSDLLALAGDSTMVEVVQLLVEMTVEMTAETLIDAVVLPDGAHLLDDEARLQDEHEVRLLDETETPEMTESERTEDDLGLLLAVDEAVEALHRMATGEAGSDERDQ
ncbi:hypothetical protein QFC21_005454 [Naganishia friedmannii]|uniref:Uncharacterized protein n=1 Tax=Naganishia friedmannii TaxID=89922 RepID=A0ACC2V946_9TREE|nr:hypothetical protein QFC21_005454 [Naganishia friedmannii]